MGRAWPALSVGGVGVASRKPLAFVRPVASASSPSASFTAGCAARGLAWVARSPGCPRSGWLRSVRRFRRSSVHQAFSFGFAAKRVARPQATAPNQAVNRVFVESGLAQTHHFAKPDS